MLKPSISLNTLTQCNQGTIINVIYLSKNQDRHQTTPQHLHNAIRFAFSTGRKTIDTSSNTRLAKGNRIHYTLWHTTNHQNRSGNWPALPLKLPKIRKIGDRFSTLRFHTETSKSEKEEGERTQPKIGPARDILRRSFGRFSNASSETRRRISRSILRGTVVRTRLVSKRLVTVTGRPRRRTPPHSQSYICKRAATCGSVNRVTSRLGSHATANRPTLIGVVVSYK